jgi:nucleoside-diphosphate-sugar epimerase
LNLLVTGSSGFVGVNVRSYFTELENEYTFIPISREILYQYDEDKIKNVILNGADSAIIHLAGKAHDLKKTSSSSDYYTVNTELTKKVFDAFLKSASKCFIFLSSVKAVADEVEGKLHEDRIPNSITHYGKSKLLAEEYILSKQLPANKRVYILRPCMIHGPGNKGNLNLLYKIVSKGIPWPLGSFQNQRSFCSVENLCFIIKELIERNDIPSGIYNVADDEPISTNRLIQLIASSQNKTARISKIPKSIITLLARVGDFLHLPLNSERLQKLTESYLVGNEKIKAAIRKPLPISSEEGLLKTLQSFNSHA